MNNTDSFFEVEVFSRNGRRFFFENIGMGTASYRVDGYSLSTGEGPLKKFTLKPENPVDSPAKIIYRWRMPMRNFHKVIVPASGREYMMQTYLVYFWSAKFESTISDVKMPIVIFLGQDMKTALTFGIIGDLVETRIGALDFTTPLWTLVAHKRRLSLQIERGFDDIPLPANMRTRDEDGSVTEHIYMGGLGMNWVRTMREFSNMQRQIFNIKDKIHPPSLEPIWCSWVDWNSEEINEKVILDSVKAGVSLGIRNFILDDGWFGKGLDCDDGAPNLGDYRPDTERFPDLKGLSGKVKKLGGRLILWTGPHCACKNTSVERQHRNLLITDSDGNLSWNGKYFSLCLMSPESRKYMRDMIVGFIRDYDVDGIKMDLFNGIKAKHCYSKEHSHDTTSLTKGLEALLAEIYAACTELKPDFIIELKQNYATPFLSQYGTLTRSGDSPYGAETNFMRAAFIQGYTDAAENDYMTVNGNDSPLDTAIIIIKMMAVGVPAFSNKFDIMPESHMQICRNYNKWYLDRIEDFKGFRDPVDDDLRVWRAGKGSRTTYFIVNSGNAIEKPKEKKFEILNGTASGFVMIKFDGDVSLSVETYDLYGNPSSQFTERHHMLFSLEIPPGGRAEINVME